MTEIFGSYQTEILSAYAVATFVLTCLVAFTIRESRRTMRQLRKLERRSDARED